jgi:hypothetical protein
MAQLQINPMNGVFHSHAYFVLHQEHMPEVSRRIPQSSINSLFHALQCFNKMLNNIVCSN